MAPLKNTRHERFVAALLESHDATEAYGLAGYTRDDANACRLKSNPKVAERLAELQAEIAAETTVTVQGLINELESARKAATDLKQLSAAIKAIEGKAKLSGLLVEKKQVEVGGPGSFAGCDTAEAIQARMVEDFLKFEVSDYHDLRGEDAEQIRGILAEGVAFMGERWQRASTLVKAIKDRPVKITYKPPKDLPPHANGKGASA